MGFLQSRTQRTELTTRVDILIAMMVPFCFIYPPSWHAVFTSGSGRVPGYGPIVCSRAARCDHTWVHRRQKVKSGKTLWPQRKEHACMKHGMLKNAHTSRNSFAFQVQRTSKGTFQHFWHKTRPCIEKTREHVINTRIASLYLNWLVS